MATLVRRRADAPTRRAVLYLHGFVDYFFQTHLAEFFTDRGFDFYALDLRKYGRSLLPHQTPNFCARPRRLLPGDRRGGADHPRRGRSRHLDRQRALHRRPDRRAVGRPGPGHGLVAGSVPQQPVPRVQRAVAGAAHGRPAGQRRRGPSTAAAHCRRSWARRTAGPSTSTTAASGATTWPGSRSTATRSTPAGSGRSAGATGRCRARAGDRRTGAGGRLGPQLQGSVHRCRPPRRLGAQRRAHRPVRATTRPGRHPGPDRGRQA